MTYVDKRITLEELMKNTWLYPPVYESPKKQFNLQLNIGHRITKFKGFSKLKKSLLCYIASQLSESEIGELRDIFLNLSDKDGRINFEQFEKGFNGIKHMNKDKESLKAIFEGMDVNHEGTVDYTGKSFYI